MSHEVSPSALVLIIDVNPMIWKIRSMQSNEQQIILTDLIKQISMFCCAYSMTHRRNMLIVLGNHPESVECIFPVGMQSGSDSFVPIIHEISSILADGILSAADYSSISDSDALIYNRTDPSSLPISKFSLANSISTALCVLNKLIQKDSTIQPRILIVQSQADHQATYNAVMNSVFSALKLNVPIDAIALTIESSNFLQQACFLSKGIYQHPKNQSDLLQILLTHYLASSSARRLLYLPQQKSVEFKAACSCHRRTMEFAYMCSVCLALVCDTHPSCPTCNAPVRKKQRNES